MNARQHSNEEGTGINYVHEIHPAAPPADAPAPAPTPAPANAEGIDDELKFETGLKLWALKYNIPRIAVSELLKLLLQVN